MTHKPYPWQAVEKVSESRESAAKRSHAELLADLEQAHADRERALLAQRQNREQMHAAAQASFAPSQGCLAARLQRYNAYLESLRARAVAIQESIQKAQKRVREVRVLVEAARAELGDAYAHRKTVERHRDRFEVAQKKQGENRAERETEDQLPLLVRSR